MMVLMLMLLWVLAGLTGHLVKWLLRWLRQIKVCLSSVPFDDVDNDDDYDECDNHNDDDDDDDELGLIKVCHSTSQFEFMNLSTKTKLSSIFKYDL